MKKLQESVDVSKVREGLANVRKVGGSYSPDAVAKLCSYIDTLEAEVARLREALKIADMAINPPDRGGISLDHWNVRLKNATGVIRAALGNQQ